MRSYKKHSNCRSNLARDRRSTKLIGNTACLPLQLPPRSVFSRFHSRRSQRLARFLLSRPRTGRLHEPRALHSFPLFDPRDPNPESPRNNDYQPVPQTVISCTTPLRSALRTDPLFLILDLASSFLILLHSCSFHPADLTIISHYLLFHPLAGSAGPPTTPPGTPHLHSSTASRCPMDETPPLSDADHGTVWFSPHGALDQHRMHPAQPCT